MIGIAVAVGDKEGHRQMVVSWFRKQCCSRDK